MTDIFEELRQLMGITPDMPESVRDAIAADRAGVSVDWYRRKYKNRPHDTEKPVHVRAKSSPQNMQQSVRPPRETCYWLYRMFNENGALLYVGITEVGVARWRQHQREKEWFNEVRAFTVETFPSRDAVAKAELQAIRTEHPKYNYTGASH